MLHLLLLLVQLLSSDGKRKPPPTNWDKGPCLHLQNDYGDKAGCRKCNDIDLGFGENYNKMIDQALRDLHQPTTKKEKTWLRIGIGTVPRKTEQPYLERVLLSIADELPHQYELDEIPKIGRVQVLVVNFRPKKHPVFDRIRKKLAPPHPAAAHFTFIELEPVRCDPPVPQNWEYKKGLSPEVSPRQQTRDVISLYKTLKRWGGHSNQVTCQHALIVEDDFELCPGGLHLIKHAINKASKGGFSGLRVGEAGNGIIFPCGDIDPISSYLQDHQFMMPVDLLLPEWFIRIHKRAKGYLHESSVFRINDKNLFNHIGMVSSFNDGRGQRKTSMCGQILKSKTWMKQESFDTKCTRYGLSPCTDASMKINSVELKYHSGSNSRSVPGYIQVIQGNVGESCDAACARSVHIHPDNVKVEDTQKGLTCGANDFIFINNCRYLRRDFQKCRGGCVTLQTMVAQDSVDSVAKHIFGALSPGALMGGEDGKSKESSNTCWHRQSHKQHIMVSHVNAPSSCSASHPKVLRLCPCIDISLQDKKK